MVTKSHSFSKFPDLEKIDEFMVKLSNLVGIFAAASGKFPIGFDPRQKSRGRLGVLHKLNWEVEDVISLEFYPDYILKLGNKNFNSSVKAFFFFDRNINAEIVVSILNQK